MIARPALGFGPRRRVDAGVLLAFAVVGGATLFVRLAVTGRELVAAQRFGVGDTMDAFFIAFMIPTFLVGVIGTSFNAAFMPVYVETRERDGDAAAKQLLANVSACSATLLVMVAAIVAIAFPFVVPFLASDFSAAKLALTVRLFYVLLPMVVIGGLSTLWGAALNSVGRFALAALAPAMSPLLAILLLVTRGHAWGGYSLAAGVAVGSVGEATIVWFALRRRGIAAYPRWHGLDSATGAVLKQYVPTTLGAFLMGTTVIVDQVMAASLGSGSVSILNFGQRIVSFVLGIAGLAIGTAVMPFFSKIALGADRARIRAELRPYLWLVLGASAIVTLLLVALSSPLVHALFQRGSFTAADVADVSHVQRLFALQVPFYLGGILLVRLVASLRANLVLTAASAVNVVVNVVLNYVLMHAFGVPGIALSTSFVYLVSFLFVYVALRRRLAETA